MEARHRSNRVVGARQSTTGWAGEERLVIYERMVLPNGVRVLTAPMAHVRSVSIGLYFGVGSRYEDAALAGISHLIEHMLFKGSERFPSAQVISETIEGVGGMLDAATDKELTTFSAKVASPHLDLALALLADMVRFPRFAADELEKERRVILDELGMYRDSPPDWVSVLADELFWPGLPLGREVAGSDATVRAITQQALAAYHREHYIPSNLVVSIAGDLTHERAIAAVRKLMDDWPAAAVPRARPCPPPADVSRVRVERRRIEQTSLALLTLGLARTDPDYYAQVLLNTVLGDSMSSRLFLEVRERRGLAYDVSSGPQAFADSGAFGVYAGVEPTRAEEALRAILAELARMRDEPVSTAELARAREYTKGRMILGLEDTASVAGWLGGQEALLGTVHDLDEVLRRLDAVAASDIQRVAGRMFRDEWLRLAAIGPRGARAAFDRALRL